MAYEFKVTRRVEFSETDLAGIMHFSNFFRFMETAEHAFLRSLGFSVILSRFGPDLCLPRVHASCDYKAPLRFEDEVEIRLLVARKSQRTLAYQFRFSRLREAEASHPDERRGSGVAKARNHHGVAQEVARGTLTVVCAARQPNGALKATPLPPLLAERIQVAPEALLHPERGTAAPGKVKRFKR